MITIHHFKKNNIMIKLEFSEEQQAFHFNYGDCIENSNGYKTIFEGDLENINPILEKLKDARDNKRLTYLRIDEIINDGK